MTNIADTNKNPEYAHDILGETSLWDDPTLVHDDLDFREVKFDDGGVRKQLNVAKTAPKVIQPHQINIAPPKEISK